MDGGLLNSADVTVMVNNYRCHGRFGGVVLADNHPNTTAVLESAHTLKTTARGAWLLPFVSATSSIQALELGDGGTPLAMPRVAAASGVPAESAAYSMLSSYTPMYQMLTRHWTSHQQCSQVGSVSHKCIANQTLWKTNAPMVFTASLDVCSYHNDSSIRFQAFAALAFGARGIFWRGARQCAGLSTPKFNLVASVNSRIAGWGDVFISSTAGGSGGQGDGYNITRLWSSGWALPIGANAVAPGSIKGGLVETMDLMTMNCAGSRVGCMRTGEVCHSVDLRREQASLQRHRWRSCQEKSV